MPRRVAGASPFTYAFELPSIRFGRVLVDLSVARIRIVDALRGLRSALEAAGVVAVRAVAPAVVALFLRRLAGTGAFLGAAAHEIQFVRSQTSHRVFSLTLLGLGSSASR